MAPKEALEKLTNYKCSSMSEKIECKKIIETALDRLEELENNTRTVFVGAAGGRMSGKTYLTIEKSRLITEYENVIEILRTYIFKDHLLFRRHISGITYVGLKMAGGVKMPAYEFYYAMPADKAEIIRRIFK